MVDASHLIYGSHITQEKYDTIQQRVAEQFANWMATTAAEEREAQC